MNGEFPAEIRQFIAQHIESLAELETLLAMREYPERQWGLADLAKKLYIPADECSRLLADLAGRGFVRHVSEADSNYQYRPANPEADRLLAQLATIYQQRRVAVITEIYSKPVKKVQTFADAFRLRREE